MSATPRCWPISRRVGRASKILQLTQALTGRFNEYHALLVKVHLHLIDQCTRTIDDLTVQIEVMMETRRSARKLMITTAGVSTMVADVIAEAGADMCRFPTAGHLRRGPGPARVPTSPLVG